MISFPAGRRVSLSTSIPHFGVQPHYHRRRRREHPPAVQPWPIAYWPAGSAPCPSRGATTASTWALHEGPSSQAASQLWAHQVSLQLLLLRLCTASLRWRWCCSGESVYSLPGMADGDMQGSTPQLQSHARCSPVSQACRHHHERLWKEEQ